MLYITQCLLCKFRLHIHLSQRPCLPLICGTLYIVMYTSLVFGVLCRWSCHCILFHREGLKLLEWLYCIFPQVVVSVLSLYFWCLLCENFILVTNCLNLSFCTILCPNQGCYTNGGDMKCVFCFLTSQWLGIWLIWFYNLYYSTIEFL